MKRVEPYVILILLFLLLFSVKQCQDNSEKASEVRSMYEASLDSLTTYKNQKGDLVNRISTITVSNIKLFSELKSKDSSIIALQELAKDYKKQLKNSGSGGIIYIQGEKEIVTETKVDTITGDYFGDFNLDNWVWGDFKVNENKSIFNISTREEVSFIIGKENTGFLGLGKPKYFSDVKLANPYNSVSQFRTFNVDLPQPKWVISIGASGVYNFADSNIIIGPSVNIGYIIKSW